MNEIFGYCGWDFGRARNNKFQRGEQVRICRNIYYADWCPMDNRKNYRKIFENFLAILGLTFFT